MTKVNDNLLVRVLLDRLQVTSAAPRPKPPTIGGFEVVWDRRVPPQTDIPTYGRCRKYRSRNNDTKIFWHYQPRCPWLKPWKITLIADDRYGLKAGEVWKVVRHCESYRILIVELALDFSMAPPVNEAFVRRHGIFGKSRRRGYANTICEVNCELLNALGL
ncbi:MAG: hypothetical protein ABSF85_18075 [Terriglobales bacterium]